MKSILRKLKIKHLLNKGYESYTITINGKLTQMIFYNPERIYKYDKTNFNY